MAFIWGPFSSNDHLHTLYKTTYTNYKYTLWKHRILHPNARKEPQIIGKDFQLINGRYTNWILGSFCNCSNKCSMSVRQRFLTSWSFTETSRSLILIQKSQNVTKHHRKSHSGTSIVSYWCSGGWIIFIIVTFFLTSSLLYYYNYLLSTIKILVIKFHIRCVMWKKWRGCETLLFALLEKKTCQKLLSILF